MKPDIAIFRALFLGDMLCIIPTVRAIRGAWPHARITLVGLPWQATVAERFNAYFDDFIPFPGWPGLPEQEVNPKEVLTFLQKMQDRKFDIVFQMQGNGTVTNTMCQLWGADRVCGLRTPGGWCPDSRYFPESADTDHEVLRFFKLLECFNIEPKGMHLEFPVSNEEDAAIRKKLSMLELTSGNYVCLHPGARDVRRRWPKENFARIANELARNGHMIVLTGSGEERALLESLERMIDGPVINAVKQFGHLPLGELAALLRHSKLLVSNDTGVSHVAAALSIPSVIIFSRWSEITRWRPLEEANHVAVPYEQSANVALVWTRISDLLRRSTAPASEVVS